ncbi:Coiled-coil domain-containing protein 86 [Channa argus]|uniref:Coiled-coil domain-containing protein 86 n=1 Tax=Channa argus TaxID=215402 RepID=A0A6G1PBV6_CHAAH|nr:Coiled-coil domain-containing protein 86 [Channa argus]KAK2918902.1 hypothetical protein Q8A73_003273 [Channa argus]
MTRRQKALTEQKSGSEVEHGANEVQELPPEGRRTRSGRTVRTPAALLDSKGQVKTPSRRTRRSVLQELPVVEEKNTEPEQNPESLSEEKASMSTEPEPCNSTVSEAEAVGTKRADVNEEGHLSTTTETVPQKKPRLAPSWKQDSVIPLGKPKSGRVWKDRNKQRFSAMVRDKPLCTSWEKKMEAKREKQLVKQYTLQLKEEKARQKEDKRKRREENLKRRAENERKAEIVQVIRNTAKIKRMKKKQLRKIEKRDTLAVLQRSPKQNTKTKGQQKNKVDQDLT